MPGITRSLNTRADDVMAVNIDDIIGDEDIIDDVTNYHFFGDESNIMSIVAFTKAAYLHFVNEDRNNAQSDGMILAIPLDSEIADTERPEYGELRDWYEFCSTLVQSSPEPLEEEPLENEMSDEDENEQESDTDEEDMEEVTNEENK